MSKALLASLAPPALLGVLRAVRRRFVPPEWEYVENGWAHAHAGWETSEVADVERRRWPTYLEQLGGTGPFGPIGASRVTRERQLWWHNLLASHALVFALAGRQRHALKVLDWGGGLGHLRLLAETILPGTRLEYHVRDLSELCSAGRELQPDVAYHEHDGCLEDVYDLVIASGSLHYVRDWQPLLRRLVGATSAYLYVTRVPVVSTAPSYPVLQRAWEYQTEYVGWVLNRQVFLDAAQMLGLELIREFALLEAPRIHRAPEQSEGRGFLFRPAA